MDYGKKSSDTEHVIPGSPDARDPYKVDMYDKMGSMKNKTATGAPNTGIQGDADSSTQNKAAPAKSKGKTYKSDYGTKMGSQVDNSVGAGDEYDYGKGRKKKPMKSKRRG